MCLSNRDHLVPASSITDLACIFYHIFLPAVSPDLCLPFMTDYCSAYHLGTMTWCLSPFMHQPLLKEAISGAALWGFSGGKSTPLVGVKGFHSLV